MLISRGGHEEVVYVFGAVTRDSAVMAAFLASFNIGAQFFKNLNVKLFYSSKTYNLLNYLTLEISDPDIKQQFALARANHFNRIFKPIFILQVLYFLRHLIDVLINP